MDAASGDAFADVPSPIDLRTMEDARPWAASALAKRPVRPEFFARFASAIAEALPQEARVLELGSGPGFLALHLLEALPRIRYDALDFSPAMHALARARLADAASRVRFIERSFREPDWTTGLGPYDAVVTHQAIHELRHKRHAEALHRQVRALLRPQGLYLACDHFVGEGGMTNDALYMTIDEQRHALERAGFGEVRLLLSKGGLALHQARDANHSIHRTAPP
jgi:SAM-dependent methyltransferase